MHGIAETVFRSSLMIVRLKRLRVCFCHVLCNEVHFRQKYTLRLVSELNIIIH